MVNGIIGSAGNWRFAANQFVKRFPEDVVVQRSRCNSNFSTFDGVDVMGERLAEEVLSVARSLPELKRISFVAHSLGGLIARYAIARLYIDNNKRKAFEENGNYEGSEFETQCLEEKLSGTIAGLEPINFITFATPHLGSRWHKQIPILCGFHALEKGASHIAWICGRTGRHLFLNDNGDGKPPLLLQMVNDSGDLKFISALQSFRRRVAYSNSCSDHIVGWKTSSIRHENELPTRQQFSKNLKYPHVVHVEMPKTEDTCRPVLFVEKTEKNDMEEAMIQGLNRVTWERVDISFKKSIQRIFAHSTIQVAQGTLITRHVPATHQLADLLTKPLPGPSLQSIITKLGVYLPPSPTLRGTVETDDTSPTHITPTTVEDDPDPGICGSSSPHAGRGRRVTKSNPSSSSS